MKQFKLPNSDWGKFTFFFVSQFISYFLIVANGRAFNQGSYLWTGTTDTLIGGQNFLMVRLISKDSNDLHGLSLLGYMAGGTVGSLFAIWTTLHVYGK